MRALLGILIASVLMFVWGFLYWGLLPISSGVLKTLPNQDAIVPVLNDNIPATGVYMIPSGSDQTEPTQDVLDRHLRGPVATLIFQKEGGPMMPPSTLLKGYLHMLVATVLAALVLMASGRREYFGRFMICFWLGAFVAVWPELSRMIWFSFPKEYVVLYMVYHFSTCVLMGIVLSAFVKPAEIEGS